MSYTKKSYAEVRGLMQPGDMIAFGGDSPYSKLIKFVTKSSVSHIAIILQSKLLIGDTVQVGKLNQVIEATTYQGFTGVSINRLSARLASYHGNIWWLPLSQQIREKMDTRIFFDFMLHQEGKPYDYAQSFNLGVDHLDQTDFFGDSTENTEDFSKLFCSELAAAGLEAAGAIAPLNASAVTPIDLCRFNLYKKDYYQIKGEGTPITGYNSIDPQSWAMAN